MKIKILGSGTSTGVPVIGCNCRICGSGSPKNIRTRASITIEKNGKTILVDTSTDLRQQALSNNLRKVNAVLFTHTHADHIHGIDELRSFNIVLGAQIPCYAKPAVVSKIKRLFPYIFSDEPGDSYTFTPRIELSPIEAPSDLFGIRVIPIDIYHGPELIFGYRFDDAAYLTDCSGIPRHSEELLSGLKLLIIGALRHMPHPTHYSISQAIEEARRLSPCRAIFTHLGHEVDYKEAMISMPPGMELAYDGLEVEI